MGLGLAQYLPSVIYWLGILAAILSIFYSPRLGILFLFPLLPYQSLFEKMQMFYFGKDINDIIIFSIFIGWLLRRNAVNNRHAEQMLSSLNNSSLTIAISLVSIVTFVGFLNGCLSLGLSTDTMNTYIEDFKNYLLLPFIWFLTYKNIKDRKTLRILTLFLVMGITGIGYYFFKNLGWMNVWHYSDKAKDMMTGLFVYLGANYYGAFFAHFVFIPLGIFLFDKSVIRRIILLCIIWLTVYCLAFTYSRGAYLALLGGMIFVGIVKEKRILLLFIIFLFIWRALVPISVRERIEMTQNEQGDLEESAAMRFGYWETAWKMFSESPIIGKGFNAFQTTTSRDTHNQFMKMLSDLGIIGLLAFLYLLYSAFMTGWRLYKETNYWLFKGLGLGFAVSVISLAITNSFGDRWSYLSLGSYFWIFLAIVARARTLNDSKLTAQTKKNRE